MSDKHVHGKRPSWLGPDGDQDHTSSPALLENSRTVTLTSEISSELENMLKIHAPEGALCQLAHSGETNRMGSGPLSHVSKLKLVVLVHLGSKNFTSF